MHESRSSDKPTVFIGSSSEGTEVARNLQAELEATRHCEVVRWDHGVFEPSGNAIDSLVREARRVDFAVLVATPDDMVESRGETHGAARDNVIFEFGLFVGALGKTRTYLLTTDDIKLPSDWQGLTRLSYRKRSDGNIRAACNDSALQVEHQIRNLGKRSRGMDANSLSREASAFIREVDLICANAHAQGWKVKTNTDTTLRLRNRRGRTFTFTKGPAASSRVELRQFAAQLRDAGLRINNSLRRRVEESPITG